MSGGDRQSSGVGVAQRPSTVSKLDSIADGADRLLAAALADDCELVKAFEKSYFEASSAWYSYIITQVYDSTDAALWRERLEERAFDYVSTRTDPSDVVGNAWMYHHLFRLCPLAHYTRLFLIRRIVVHPPDAQIGAVCRAVTARYDVDNDAAREIMHSIIQVYPSQALHLKQDRSTTGESSVITLLRRFHDRMPDLTNKESWSTYWLSHFIRPIDGCEIRHWSNAIGTQFHPVFCYCLYRCMIDGASEFHEILFKSIFDARLDIPTVAPIVHAFVGTDTLRRMLIDCIENNNELSPLYDERASLRRDIMIYDFEDDEDEDASLQNVHGPHRQARNRRMRRLDEISDTIHELLRNRIVKTTATAMQISNLRAILRFPRYAVFRLFFELAPLRFPTEVVLRIAYNTIPIETDCFRSQYALLEVHDRAVECFWRIVSQRDEQ